MCTIKIQRDSILLSGFPWHINENSDNNLESPRMLHTIFVVVVVVVVFTDQYFLSEKKLITY
jgi:hypothetical protein